MPRSPFYPHSAGAYRRTGGCQPGRELGPLSPQGWKRPHQWRRGDVFSGDCSEVCGVSALTHPVRLDYAYPVVPSRGGSDPSWVAGIGVLNSERISAHLKRFFCAPLFMAGAARALRSADPLICTPTLRHSPPSIGVVGGGSSSSEDHAMPILTQAPAIYNIAGSDPIKPRRPTPRCAY